MANGFPTVKNLVSGVDWITLTASSADTRPLVRSHMEGVIRTESELGNGITTRAWLGYQLTRSGSAAFGERAADCIAQLSGGLAGEHWRELLSYATNVSRLDLAVTLDLARPDPELGRRVYRQACRKPEGKGRPGKVTRITDNQGGQTVYLGSRKSDVYCRVYDKGVEARSAPPGTRWRFEVELKRRPAYATALKLALSGDEATAVDGMVKAELCRRGMEVWRSSRWIALERSVRTSDDEASYDWLVSAVRPTVERLRRSYSLPDILDALGLTDVSQLTRREYLRPSNEKEKSTWLPATACASPYTPAFTDRPASTS